MNSGLNNALAMVQSRLDDNVDIEAAYNDVITALKTDRNFFEGARIERIKQLREAGTSEAEIEVRTKCFDIQLDFIANVLHGARLAKHEKILPNAGSE